MARADKSIEIEIDEMAEKMVKSQTDAKQLLFDTIMELGPEGLKKANETLPPEQQELLKSCLEEFAKAAKKPEPVSEDKAADKDMTDANKMRQESQSGSDDQDEKKLMDEKNAEHPHQGGPAPKDRPEGWDGQVIKAKVEKEEPEVEMPAKEAVKEHKRLVNVLESESHEDDKDEAKKQKKELAEYKKEMKKGEPSKEAVSKLVEMEEAEHKTDIDGDGKIAEKLEKDKKVKKSLEEIVALAKSLNMSKEDVVKAVKEAGNDLELVKSDMEKKKKLLAEEEQSKTKMQDESQAEKIPQDKGALEIKSEQTADEVKAPMKKSIVWAPKNVLAANTLGRNTHYDVDAFIQKSEEEKQDTIKKGAYFGETQSEPLKKSDSPKADINEMIEKGMDYSTEEIKRIEGIRDHKVEGKIVKSFYDKDIAAALGMTEEEAKKLLGE